MFSVLSRDPGRDLVEGRSELPKTVRRMEKAVIAEMVVNIGDEDRESHSPPKLLDVGTGRGTVHAQGVDDLRVTVLLDPVRLDPEERRRGFRGHRTGG